VNCLFPLLSLCFYFLHTLYFYTSFLTDGSTDAFQIVHTLSEAKYLLNLLFSQSVVPGQGQGTSTAGRGREKEKGREREGDNKATRASLDDRKSHHPTPHTISNTATATGKSSASSTSITTSSTSSRSQVLLALKGDLEALSAPSGREKDREGGKEKDREGGKEKDREGGKEKDREGGKESMQQRLALFNKTPLGAGVALGGGVSRGTPGIVASTTHSSGIIGSKTTVYPVKMKPPLPLMKSKSFPRPPGGPNATVTASTAATAMSSKNCVTSSTGRMSNISLTATATNSGCNGASVNTNINRKNNAANVAASFVKMKENISKCLPPNGGGGGGTAHIQKNLMERKNKFDKFMVQKTVGKPVKKILVRTIEPFPFLYFF
jgi:hypothetical protein